MEGRIKRNPIGRALQVVTLLANDDPSREWGVREISTRLQLPASAVHRTLSALEDESWVERATDSGAYRLSLEVFRLAGVLATKMPLKRLALPVMQELVTECNETALLGLFDASRLQMSFVAQIESPHPLRYAIDLYRWGSIHAGATGLAIFAFLDEHLREQVLARGGLNALTDRTVTDGNEIRHQLSIIREQGYAISKGQRITGSVGIAAPIFGPDGAVIGDLAVTVPADRYAEIDNEQGLALSVVRHASFITDKLKSH